MTHTSAKSRRPLEAFPLIRTRSVDELANSIARLYGKNTVALPRGAQGFAVHTNHCQFQSVGVTYGTHGARLQIELPTFGQYAQLFSCGGTAEATAGRARAEVGRECAVVATIDETLKLDYASNFEQLAVKINAEDLVRKLEAIGGERLSGPLRFELVSAGPGMKSLRKLIQFLIDQIDSTGPALHSLAVAEIEQAVMVSYLCANRHTYSHWLDQEPSRAAPWQVHLVEEYVEANWDQPITIEALAVVTGASARSIFHTFKRSRGYSPMDFVKELRLRHAKDILLSPMPGTSVTDVAFACGFGNLGHFSNYYRRRFGELPSRTLSHAREIRP